MGQGPPNGKVERTEASLRNDLEGVWEVRINGRGRKTGGIRGTERVQ